MPTRVLKLKNDILVVIFRYVKEVRRSYVLLTKNHVSVEVFLPGGSSTKETTFITLPAERKLTKMSPGSHSLMASQQTSSEVRTTRMLVTPNKRLVESSTNP